ncbi:ribosomal lysine N-methyltransferase 4-like [Salvia hispanica]|uniref:ribosomal lysine N-methyltransferase 4-like n=1 Tax=Salvia hispanica TaxID=49212 RepID=UPI0020095336|nr:ribosomal lysine N-methyltransferase 4-like [Salvia hispanica]
MAAARKMIAFKRWMKEQGVEWSDALLFATESGCADDSPPISVEALSDLKEGDVVAKIPKQSCLTVATSAASELIEEAELGGNLGLCFALMYEKILDADSKWFEYLQILPNFEPIPLLWSISEIDSLLAGTELHKTVKEDKALVFEDWKECIKPVLELDSFELKPESFTVDEYFAAKSLVASRSFQVDEYHGYGMVPLADLFNHKTAAEDVHITTESDNDTGSEKEGTDHESDGDDSTSSEKEGNDHESDVDDEPVTHDSHSEGGDGSGSDLELSSGSGNESPFLEIIMIKDVKAGAEVFNTYGHLGNAALLHRYGFTEADNPFDILNIDLDIVVQWSLSLFSCHQSRRRLSIWRKMGYSGCGDQDSEYFEISCDGEPQDELLVLLYIMLLPKDESRALDQAVSGTGETNAAAKFQLLNKEIVLSAKGSDPSKKLLLTPGVGVALSSLADARESLYGPSSLEEDVKSRDRCCRATEGKLYHSLMLRISERRILEKLRRYSATIVSANGGRKRKGTETRL